MKINIKQSILKEKFYKLFEINAAYKLTESDKKIKGFCFGLALIYGFMKAKENEKVWKSYLEDACSWDGKAESLKKILTKYKNKPSLGTVLEIVFDYVMWYHAIIDRFIKTDTTHCVAKFGETEKDRHKYIYDQKHILNKGNFIFFGKGYKYQITYKKELAGYFDNISLKSFLNDNRDVFDQKDTIFLIGGNKHSCSFGYKKTIKQWWFYDANHEYGEVNYSNTDEFVKVVFKKITSLVYIKIISWHKNGNGNRFSKFVRHYEDLLDEKKSILLSHPCSLKVIQSKANEYFPAIIKKVKENQNGEEDLQAALKKYLPRYKRNLLNYLKNALYRAGCHFNIEEQYEEQKCIVSYLIENKFYNEAIDNDLSWIHENDEKHKSNIYAFLYAFLTEPVYFLEEILKGKGISLNVDTYNKQVMKSYLKENNFDQDAIKDDLNDLDKDESNIYCFLKEKGFILMNWPKFFKRETKTPDPKPKKIKPMSLKQYLMNNDV